jgi:dihydropteroate synthase
LVWGAKTYVMAIVNATPDSFSDDGIGDSVTAAVELAERAVAAGADIIDIGAESTRPGHRPIPANEELARLLPVLEAVRERVALPISIDTSKAAVADRALAAGADIINDVRGLMADPELAMVIARHAVPVVIMHDVPPAADQDLIASIRHTLAERIERARAAGIARDRVIVDPGIGFGKTWRQSLELLRRLPELRALGRPLLVGTSRKSTIGRVLGLPPSERVEGTAATVALAIAGGVDIVRVHDVLPMVRVARMSDAIIRGAPAEAATWEGAPASAETTA